MVVSNVVNSEPAVLVDNSVEASNGKFRNFAKESFQFEAKSSIEYLKSFKESIKFFHLDVPPQLNEIFVRIEDAPLFWIYESPIVQYLEDVLRIYLGKSKDYDHYKTIKECYTKWIVIKSENEKQYFASSTLNYIDKSSSKHNFFYLILKAVLFTYEKSIANTATACDLLNKSIDVINSTKVSETYKDELLYFINVFIGFAYLKHKETEPARESFNKALAIKPYGITAKFYLAVVEVQQSDYEAAEELVKNLSEYDLSRIEYSIKKNNAGMFKYFVNNSVVYNLFYHREFAVMINQIEANLYAVLTPDSALLAQLKTNLSKLVELEMKSYYVDETNKTIAFLGKLIDHYLESKNMLVHASYRYLTRKFNEMGMALYEGIKSKYANEVRERLKAFDDQIQEKRYSITLLTNDFESLKTKQKEKLAAAIKEIGEKIEEYILIVESKINAIPLETKHDPVYSFKNMMTYNIIISSLLFFIGGCSGYSSQYFSGGIEFKEILGQLIIAGIKWGLGTFLVGFLLAIVVAISTFVSRTAYKQKLVQKINWLKNQKELEISGTRKEFEAKEKLLKESFDDRIADLKASIEELQKDRATLESETKAEADEKLRVEAEPLLALISPESE